MFPFDFHPNSFTHYYCSSHLVGTKIPGFSHSEAKDSIPVPCQDTLSVPSSLQTGWREGAPGELDEDRLLEKAKVIGGEWPGKYKKFVKYLEI